jgi:hypothetical protein
MPKKEGRKKENKYTRREVLKSGARIAGGTAVYGTIGYFGGKGYQTLKDIYNSNVRPTVDFIKERKNNFEEGKKSLQRKLDYTKREAKVLLYGEKAVEAEEDIEWQKQVKEMTKKRLEAQKKREEELNRRGFLSHLGDFGKGYLSLIHSNPIPTLTISGMAYGATKSTIKVIPKYLKEKEIARLKDENTEYKERLNILENYKRRIEESEENNTKETKSELERIGEILENAGRASGKLETIVKEPKNEISFIAIGIIGLIISLTGGIFRLNGFIISKYTTFTSYNLCFLLILGSLLFFYFGIKGKRKKITKKNNIRFNRENI